MVKMVIFGDFPGRPVVKTLRFHYRGHGFDPWSGGKKSQFFVYFTTIKNKKSGLWRLNDII